MEIVARTLRDGEICRAVVCVRDSCSLQVMLPRRRHRKSLAILPVAALSVACTILHPTVAVDPAATFAAHLEHGGIAVDRLEHGRSGRLEPPAWLRRPGAPSFLLESDGQVLAAFWLAGSEVTVRPTASESVPAVGRVRPDWDDGAIRLTLAAGDGGALRTDVFTRQGTGMGPSTLTRTTQTVLDVRGTFEAPVRDPKGVAVGWVRVRVSPYQTAPRIYEAALPAAISPALGAATVVALNAEIDWIESHAVNVYREGGGIGSGPLQQSVPLGR